MTRRCAQCRAPILEGGRSRYCSEACADTAARGRKKLRKAQVQSRRKLIK